MKDKRKIISDIIQQGLILFVLGLALLFLFKERAALDNLGPFSFMKIVLWLAILLFVLVFIETIRNLSSSYLFRRFDPADPASLEELAKIKRYRLFRPVKIDKAGETAVLRYLHALQAKGFKEVARQSFGIILEKGKGKNTERFIIIYKPMLNVIIADRHLKEASEYILRARNKLRRNAILFVSDMESDTEMLSSAVCAVNFVPKLSPGLVFMPYVLDLRHGRLFYPQDSSGQSIMDLLYYREQKREIIGYTIFADRRK